MASEWYGRENILSAPSRYPLEHPGVSVVSDHVGLKVLRASSVRDVWLRAV